MKTAVHILPRDPDLRGDITKMERIRLRQCQHPSGKENQA
jgi:hypothetical protein